MDWKAALEEIQAERRRESGPRPSPEEIAALHAGDLSAENKEHLLERAACDPDIARELFDLHRFPDLPPVLGEDKGPNLDKRWQDFRNHLKLEQDNPEATTFPQKAPSPDADSPPGAALHSPSKPSFVQRTFRAQLGLAASFLLGVCLTAMVVEFGGLRQGDRVSPLEINLPLVELLPIERGGSRSDRLIRVPQSAGGIVITLIPPASSVLSGSTFHLTLYGETGKIRDSTQGLVPGPGGVFSLSLLRPFFDEARIEILLSSDDGREIAKYQLEIEAL